jgi:hypothetical protein
MKRVFAATCLATAFAVGLAAQEPKAPASAGQSDKDAKTVSVTGCIKAGEAPGSFILSNAKLDEKAAPSSTPGTAGTTGTTAATKPSIDPTLNLVASGGSDLSAHVGHTVTISGTLAPKAESSTSPTTAPGAPAGTAGTTAAPKSSLNVTTVSMVSASCSM